MNLNDQNSCIMFTKQKDGRVTMQFVGKATRTIVDFLFDSVVQTVPTTCLVPLLSCMA
jgi:hypothetical protein